MYNLGILGCGKVAHLHAKAIQNLPNARLAAVWSRTTHTAEEFSSAYKTKAFPDITAMIEQEAIDLVIVCTPHPFHRQPAIEAAEAGAHILIEKPLASTLQDCDEIIKSAAQNKVKLGVISQRRWYPSVRRVKDAIDAEKIGKPVFGTIHMLGWRDQAYYDSDAWRGTWEMEGGGVLVNQAPHQLDILLWYMGEIEQVYGLSCNLNHPYIEVEDTAVAIVRFTSGAIGNIVVSNSQKPGIYGKVHVHGENGASVGVQTDGGSMFIAGMTDITEPPINDIWSVPGEEDLLKNWKEEDEEFFEKIDPTVYFMEKQIEDFLEALDNDKDPLVSGEDGRKTVELFTAIYRSNRDNMPVKFPLQTEYANNDMDGRIKP